MTLKELKLSTVAAGVIMNAIGKVDRDIDINEIADLHNHRISGGLKGLRLMGAKRFMEVQKALKKQGIVIR